MWSRRAPRWERRSWAAFARVVGVIGLCAWSVERGADSGGCRRLKGANVGSGWGLEGWLEDVDWDWREDARMVVRFAIAARRRLSA